MSDIFISYSRKDERFVSRLVRDLERDGWNVYYDLKLRASQNYEEVLAREADLAKFFIVVLTPNAIESQWVRREVKTALRREKEGRTVVIPLLVAACDPSKVGDLIGPKYYADFTLDYDHGFKKMSSALEEPEGEVAAEAGEGKEGRKAMRLKEPAIIVAIIGAIATLVAAYWQFVHKPAPPNQPEMIQYAGRVIDSASQKVINGAKVSVDTHGAPQIYFSDSEGVFYLRLPAASQTAKIRIEAKGYETVERNVSLTRTGLEDIRLNEVRETPSPSPTPGKRARVQPDQINRILSSEPSNKP